MKRSAFMNPLLVLVTGSDAAASTCLAAAAEDLANVRIQHFAEAEDFWTFLPGAGLLGGLMILAWGMPSGFVEAVRSIPYNGIPLVACLPPSGGADVAGLYDAGANCVVELSGDRSEDIRRLRAMLEFWCASATLPRGVRSARI